MNQLEQIRLEKHKEFRRKTWLPQFFEKYGKFFDKEIKSKKVICRFIKKYALPNIINDDHLEYIPGIYRVRLLFTDDNLVPITKKDVSKENSNDSDDEFFVKKKNKKEQDDPDIDQILEESLTEYNKSLDKVIHESIKDHDELLNKNDVHDINDVDYDEYILNQAILESLSNNNSKLEKEKEQDQSQKNSFYFVIDIRGYINDLTQPVIVYGDTYYLSNKQMDYMKKLWNKINPETPSGLKFQQDLEYHKGLSKDIK